MNNICCDIRFTSKHDIWSKTNKTFFQNSFCETMARDEVLYKFVAASSTESKKNVSGSSSAARSNTDDQHRFLADSSIRMENCFTLLPSLSFSFYKLRADIFLLECKVLPMSIPFRTCRSMSDEVFLIWSFCKLWVKLIWLMSVVRKFSRIISVVKVSMVLSCDFCKIFSAELW